MRARYPDSDGFIERDGVKVGYEVFGQGDPAIVFTPIDAIVHSHAWKAQVPYLAQSHKVVTIDPRGNGRSDRPSDPAAYADTEFVADTIEVMNALGIKSAVLVGLCTSGWRSLLAAALHPDRVRGVVSIGTWAPFLTPPIPERTVADFDAVLDEYTGWHRRTGTTGSSIGRTTRTSSSASFCRSRTRPSSMKTPSAGRSKSARRR